MTRKSFIFIAFSLAALIGAALLYARVISIGFILGTDTFSHPYKSFAAALIASGLAWMCFIPLFKRINAPLGKSLWALIFLGAVFRAMFLGSTPIYEDDWNRYLWDGAVTIEGHNPYKHPPEITYVVRQDAPQDVKDLQALSGRNGGITGRINNPHLTTIYPPVAMAVFAISAKVKPFDLDVLRLFYLVIDGLSLWLLIKALSLYGRQPFWALLYWLNPMLIYSVYNAGHMDIILVPFLISALYLARRSPLWASLALGLAAAVKIWPLILGPVLLRGHRRKLGIYIFGGIIMGAAALLLLSPMLLSLGESSGLQAYAGGWKRSSFFFGYIEKGLAFTGDDPGSLARIFVAIIITSLSLWLAFKKTVDEQNLPTCLMIITLCLYLLSPTGYPWYILWFLPFLPFIPLYGAALLTVMVSLYYVRFAMSERDIYDLYSNVLVPLQFGLPVLILLFEGFKMRRNAHG